MLSAPLSGALSLAGSLSGVLSLEGSVSGVLSGSAGWLVLLEELDPDAGVLELELSLPVQPASRPAANRAQTPAIANLETEFLRTIIIFSFMSVKILAHTPGRRPDGAPLGPG